MKIRWAETESRLEGIRKSHGIIVLRLKEKYHNTTTETWVKMPG
jgi:hypothetical protein